MSKKLEELLGKLTDVMITGFSSLNEKIESIKPGDPVVSTKELQDRGMESVSTQTFKPVWKVQRKFKHPTEWNTLEELIEAPSFHSSEEEANNKKEQLEALNDTVKNSVKVNLSTSLLIG